jgi:hypothetical protein
MAVIGLPWSRVAQSVQGKHFVQSIRYCFLKSVTLALAHFYRCLLLIAPQCSTCSIDESTAQECIIVRLFAAICCRYWPFSESGFYCYLKLTHQNDLDAMLCSAMLCCSQALSLLEHLVKSGTERVVEDARDHLHRYIHKVILVYVYISITYIVYLLIVYIYLYFIRIHSERQ